ncbi:MAG: hypothetical protein HY960_13255 [Ignavibacteriae bacterium]|nr:hypothetical protein [Ignavibacteriota bacterium]
MNNNVNTKESSSGVRDDFMVQPPCCCVERDTQANKDMSESFMKIFFILLFLLFVVTSSGFSQHLWDLHLVSENYTGVANDTSRQNLRKLMKDEKSVNAALLLAYYHGEQDQLFILDSLRSWAYADTLPFNTFHYFNYQRVRGYFGDEGAIQGFDTLIRYNGFISTSIKLNAIYFLTEAGIFSYFDTVLNAYKKDGIIKQTARVVMGEYGKNQNYSTQIKLILENEIRDSTDYVAFMVSATVLAKFDKQSARSILEDLFYTNSGIYRSNLFHGLKKIDPEGQPERSIWAGPNEPDPYLRSEYYPGVGFIEGNLWAKRYYEPFFINFMLRQIQVEQSNLVRSEIKSFLDAFAPIKPIDSITIVGLLDTLISYKHQIAGYNWLSDSNFVIELDSFLSNALGYLSQGDSNNCYRQIKLFQEKVDEEYRDSLDEDNKTITLEGWKFLYYNAQYLLDRLLTSEKQK